LDWFLEWLINLQSKLFDGAGLGCVTIKFWGRLIYLNHCVICFHTGLSMGHYPENAKTLRRKDRILNK
jgi:hypothetical protein